MGRLSKEEKLQREKEKLQQKNSLVETEFSAKPSEKDILIGKLSDMGFKVRFESSIPIFNISSRKEYDKIRAVLGDRFSYGFTYPKGVSLDEEK